MGRRIGGEGKKETVASSPSENRKTTFADGKREEKEKRRNGTFREEMEEKGGRGGLELWKGLKEGGVCAGWQRNGPKREKKRR